MAEGRQQRQWEAALAAPGWTANGMVRARFSPHDKSFRQGSRDLGHANSSTYTTLEDADYRIRLTLHAPWILFDRFTVHALRHCSNGNQSVGLCHPTHHRNPKSPKHGPEGPMAVLRFGSGTQRPQEPLPQDPLTTDSWLIRW